MGQTVKKISVIDEKIKLFSMIDERLEESVIKTGTKLLILDPVQAHLDSGMDKENNNTIRNLTGEYKKIY